MGSLLLSWFLFSSVAWAQEAWRESPYLLPRVATGLLPPVAARLPSHPLVTDVEALGRQNGRYGGTLHILIHGANDARVLYPFGYARLVTYDETYQLVPDILEKVDVVQDRIFTLTLRRGHRWSDGDSFTAEDFRFYWQNVATNRTLSPDGPPAEMLVNGVPPRFEVVSPWTVRYSWAQPNPGFLPALAAASPLIIYRPSHYLKPFHADYAAPQSLAAQVKKAGVTNWAALYQRHDKAGLMINPDMPSLQPWVVQKGTENDVIIIARRNPYFHRVDKSERQLPYIDRIALARTPSDWMLRATLGGASDLQAAGLTLDDLKSLQIAEKRGQFNLYLWPSGRGSQLALYPNLSVRDPALRALMQDVRFRRALSLGIDRGKLNQDIYYGAGVPRANTLLPDSPLFDPDAQFMWTAHDPARARELLNEIGLPVDEKLGVRRLPDGRILSLPVTIIGEDSQSFRVLQHIQADWLKLNVELLIEPPVAPGADGLIGSESAIFLTRGVDNGLATAASNPKAWVPSDPSQPFWPLWGLYESSHHQDGAPPDHEIAAALRSLLDDWRKANNAGARGAAWQKIIRLHADQVLSIGLVGAVPQPVIASPALRNLPAAAYFNWDPGAYFGIHRPDLLWFGP